MDLETLAPRARGLFYLQAFSRLLFFWAPACTAAALGLALALANPWAALAPAGWFALMFILAVWMPSLSWERWGFALGDEEFLATHGVLIRRVVAIPTSRIQHVDTQQGPIEQWLGLARLQVYTASGMGADAVVPGLDAERAEALRMQLVRRVEGDDGV